MSSAIPPEVEHIVLQHLHSLEHLEALLALHRARDKWWTAATRAEDVGLSRGAAAFALLAMQWIALTGANSDVAFRSTGAHHRCTR